MKTKTIFAGAAALGIFLIGSPVTFAGVMSEPPSQETLAQTAEGIVIEPAAYGGGSGGRIDGRGHGGGGTGRVGGIGH
ncbi:hypothetical protein G5V57_25760 [Nordella sp. HKS 07]|uniref:hypothetical protein n=1 Tax=Nordella sp. HKS 07 TaxID=2712222 RepID=UPI0013E1F9DE|nr:hypothetical protein [Nordella sp. HKS 07]QIG50839.1 hypothetical protein G5V57_25760 [Nordella sp. HKS 07]